MSDESLALPRRMPVIPCPTWKGNRVRWTPWQPAPTLSHIEDSCDVCAMPVKQRLSFGYVQGISRASRSVKDDGILHLSAHACPACHDLKVFQMFGRMFGPRESAPSILCDSCDALCAVGADLDEARATLVVLGGWTSGNDWDLCPNCYRSEDEKARHVIRLSAEDGRQTGT